MRECKDCKWFSVGEQVVTDLDGSYRTIENSFCYVDPQKIERYTHDLQCSRFESK